MLWGLTPQTSPSAFRDNPSASRRACSSTGVIGVLRSVLSPPRTLVASLWCSVQPKSLGCLAPRLVGGFGASWKCAIDPLYLGCGRSLETCRLICLTIHLMRLLVQSVFALALNPKIEVISSCRDEEEEHENPKYLVDLRWLLICLSCGVGVVTVVGCVSPLAH